MPVESAADRAAFFNATEFGLAATYTPPAGAAVQCVILVNKADPEAKFGDAEPRAGQVEIACNADEVATPAKGGTFGPPSASVAGRDELAVTYTLMDRPRRDGLDGATWIMWAI